MKHELSREYSRQEIEELVDAWILNERDRAIMKRRLCDHITYENLGEEFSLSTRGIVRIVYKCLDKLSRHI